ncbi:hypothetical protein H0H81_008923 [Sphagnurus paluster]|uniref:Bromo domain-containing protein n=1 Tax=Sphagnurus paluster TaxID=117069 RepID=A0A9P7FQ86_9AGAR|nr:hypothetical protein H0H81_008923 [Sphagnurus paluster]
MDVSEPFESQLASPLARPGPSKPSGLTLILPALKGGKPIKSSKKSESYGLQEEKKAPRPVKLKPLKEVLTKLIAQIKKKDDYAFFLKPVDTSQVPGYTDVVKRPMDLGTMSTKVDRGRYRSLEEFASDLRLVASNAKAFNPPGTIYYTEAERIEAWGLDHISKAAATVIQYETDWNIEIEKDEEATPVNVDEDDDYSMATPMDVDDAGGSRRSPSVASQAQPGISRRPARGPQKKTAPTNKLSESIDAEGRLPGSRDGLGAFPPGSSWAQTMLSLKLKGTLNRVTRKRYRTKKERLRIEKEGPPPLADGSLDYTEMEDPFSVLSVFAQEPCTRPFVTPLHPPLFTSPLEYDPSSSQPPRPPTPFPTSINLPLDHPPPSTSSEPFRRHWLIVRNPTRSKGKDRDDDAEAADAPAWQTPRETQITDYGSFAVLAGALEAEIRRRKVPGREGDEEAKVLDVVRDTLDVRITETGSQAQEYWNAQRALDAERYLRDVIYGGADGLAYVRSLAEFSDVSMHLAAWVEREVIDPITEGRHALLRETAIELARQAPLASLTAPPSHHNPENNPERPLFSLVRNSLHLYPSATVALAALLQIKTHKIDMGALIKTPNELFQSEEEWAGKIFRERRRRRPGATKTEEVSNEVGLEMEEPEQTWMDVDASSKSGGGQDGDYEQEGPEELSEVMEYVADVIVRLDAKIKEGQCSTATSADGIKTKVSTTTAGLGFETKAEEEDPILRNLRLNLLALAKRAPLDTIARLPKDLVPEHIRHFVPTLTASG